MGSTRLPAPEFVPLLAALEKDERERDEKAIRSVRERLVASYHGDLGVFESLRPREIARVLAGEIDDGLHLFELARAREHFVNLGARLRPFYHKFVNQRAKAKRGAKRYVPDEETLRAAFGDDWALVRDAWPAVAFLVKVLELREDPLLPPEEKTVREEAYWLETEIFLTCRRPNQVEQRDIIRFVERTVSAMRLKSGDQHGLVQEVLAYVFVDVEGLQKRIIAYEPRGTHDKVFRYWVKALQNAARDLRTSRVRLGLKGEEEVTRAPGTLRRWNHEARLEARSGSPPSRKRLVDIADEKEARRQHRDPTGTFLTLTQVADNLKASESSVRNAVKRACAAGELAPQRQPNSRSYAFLPGRDEEIIERFLGPRRAPKGGRTIEAAAREADVPIERAIGFIQELAEEHGGDAGPMVGPKKVIPPDRYEFLVRMLSEGCKGAATGGSAKPRTS